ncbi:hypothetical protein S40293_07836 [Stachybotrys chartarum IBT 40293]|nr:hypothetical protein S40293_07836 [Stachybotrys chartarum IBT 40293]
MSSITSEDATSLSETASTVASSISSIATSLANSAASTTSQAPPTRTDVGDEAPGAGQNDEGIGILSFLSALGVALIIFSVQILLFLLLRNKLARIFKPKTYLVPERERTDPPPSSVIALLKAVMTYSDREVIKKCGLDAYFFLRYLKTLLVIFIPIAAVVMPILIPINYVGGRGQNVDVSETNRNSTLEPSGLDTLAWGNVRAENTSRYGAHLLMAILVVIWVCTVFFFELRVYIKVRQDYLTSAEHRLRASATTVLVNSIPAKWLSEEALLGLFDVFPGGVRNVWLNRDLTKLLDKITQRDRVHSMLEAAETELIKAAKKAHKKKQDAEEKAQRKRAKAKSLTKEERTARDAEDDARAKQMANSGQGAHAGFHAQVPHTVADGVRESQLEEDLEHGRTHDNHESGGFRIPIIGEGLSRVGHGIKGVVSKAGNEVDETLETTNGFMGIQEKHEPTQGHQDVQRRKAQIAENTQEPPRTATTADRASIVSAESSKAIKPAGARSPLGWNNAVRKLDNIEDMYVKEETKFWQFWKPPSGSYASPVPQGPRLEPRRKTNKQSKETMSAWQKFVSALPFFGGDDEETYEYPTAYNVDYKEDDVEAEWQKYLKKRHRPTRHLNPFGISWLIGIPFVTKKVDTIYWCREELARLNLEIEEDQKHPERFPLMGSAFIQFNHQVAAHMACQSVVHHIPKQMAPRMIEISPRDVVWDNMAIPWWQEWLRTGSVMVIVLAMIILWAIPVAWTAALSQLDVLIRQAEWLSFLTANDSIESFARAISGVLPTIFLALLLALIPWILNLLAGIKGAKTGAEKTEFVQIFYFVFLFIQVFLIVSIASFFAASLDRLLENLADLQNPSAVLDLLAENLPRAANYFFSYMILQALSTSSATLLQLAALFLWYVVARIFDSTARQKWTRNTDLKQIKWGSFFPVYTNFACIALVYCVIAPLISIFAIITFSLLWLAQRYAMLYVIRFDSDTGGVLYPRAINQTFTGIYVMELCMAGLFFLVRDENDNPSCWTHGMIMIIVLILTIIYQVLLNMSFAPLFRYLPITFEDEAVLRDEAFQRAQDARLGLLNNADDEDDEDAFAQSSRTEKSPVSHDGTDEIEMRDIKPRRDVLKPMKQMGTWAKGGGNQLRKMALIGNTSQATEFRQSRRRRDLEAQRAIGDALYGGFHDEIEDLTPEERDLLTRHAFQHSALRARTPTVWIPRDDLGVSDDEIRRTKEYSEHIWISNEGTALDSKLRVVYGKHPPDFSEVDLINL